MPSDVSVVKIATLYSAQYAAGLNYEFEKENIASKDYGIGRFRYKKVTVEVAVSQGSPVGQKTGAGTGTVTAQLSSSTASGIKSGCGGIATIAQTVAAGTQYQAIQIRGVNFYALKTTGAVVADAQLEWSGNDTVIAFSTAANLFGRTNTAAASGAIVAGAVDIF